jgi:hypothetical protein
MRIIRSGIKMYYWYLLPESRLRCLVVVPRVKKRLLRSIEVGVHRVQAAGMRGMRAGSAFGAEEDARVI